MTEINHALLKRLAPGTDIRDGLERIRRGRTGALIVLGFDDQVASLCDGGFEIDVPFAATRLRELCKMDGAVVLSTDGSRIKRANVQLVPDPSLPTEESGTRHRSAERTSLQTNLPVIAVSQSMNLITVYANGSRHVLKDSAEIIARANQALGAIERYRTRLDEEDELLFDAEISGFASASAVVGLLRVSELLRRASYQVSVDVISLGSDGHQLDVQLQELINGLDEIRNLILLDYLVTAAGLPKVEDIERALSQLENLPESELLGVQGVAQVLGFPSDPDSLDERVDPRGFRALSRIPRVQQSLMRKLAEEYVTLPKLIQAPSDELADVTGIGPLWARHIRKGLDRLL